jgi:hypothetical protein
MGIGTPATESRSMNAHRSPELVPGTRPGTGRCQSLPLAGIVRVVLLAGLTGGAGAACAQDALGRLFFTPAQRAQIDEARRRPAAPEPVREAVVAPAQPQPQPQSVSVDGIVRRNDGQATVWVNRKPTAAPEQAGAVRIGPVRDASDGADLRLPDGGRRVRIKVGQEVDVQSGRIQERYRQPAAAPQPVAPEMPAAGATGATGTTGAANTADAAAAPAAGSTRAEPPRDAAVDRLLRELGRRLDEPARSPAREPEPAR